MVMIFLLLSLRTDRAAYKVVVLPLPVGTGDQNASRGEGAEFLKLFPKSSGGRPESGRPKGRWPDPKNPDHYALPQTVGTVEIRRSAACLAAASSLCRLEGGGARQCSDPPITLILEAIARVQVFRGEEPLRRGRRRSDSGSAAQRSLVVLCGYHWPCGSLPRQLRGSQSDHRRIVSWP